MFVFAAQLGAQATDVHVDGTGAAVIVVSPHLLQELRAREHTAGMLHQILQQFEFLVRQIDGPAVQRCRVAVGIHHEIAGTDLAILGALRIVRGAGARDRRIAAFRHQSQAPLHLGG